MPWVVKVPWNVKVLPHVMLMHCRAMDCFGCCGCRGVPDAVVFAIGVCLAYGERKPCVATSCLAVLKDWLDFVAMVALLLDLVLLHVPVRCGCGGARAVFVLLVPWCWVLVVVCIVAVWMACCCMLALF